MNQTLCVSALNRGTVIDHISCGKAITILHLLNLKNYHKKITLGLNLKSRSLGYKDLIKIEDRFFTKEEVNQLALISPNMTLNIIKEFKITEKFSLTLPEIVKGITSCPNPSCITHQEYITSVFSVHERQKQLYLRCQFCEKSFQQNEFSILTKA